MAQLCPCGPSWGAAVGSCVSCSLPPGPAHVSTVPHAAVSSALGDFVGSRRSRGTASHDPAVSAEQLPNRWQGLAWESQLGEVLLRALMPTSVPTSSLLASGERCLQHPRLGRCSSPPIPVLSCRGPPLLRYSCCDNSAGSLLPHSIGRPVKCSPEWQGVNGLPGSKLPLKIRGLLCMR